MSYDVGCLLDTLVALFVQEFGNAAFMFVEGNPFLIWASAVKIITPDEEKALREYMTRMNLGGF